MIANQNREISNLDYAWWTGQPVAFFSSLFCYCIIPQYQYQQPHSDSISAPYIACYGSIVSAAPLPSSFLILTQPNLTLTFFAQYLVGMCTGHQNDGGKYVEYLAPATGTDEDPLTPAEADMTIDGQGQGLAQGVEQGQEQTPGAKKPRVKVPLPGLKQTYGGHAHLQSLLARKTNKPPGVQGGCWDRMFVVFTGENCWLVGWLAGWLID